MNQNQIDKLISDGVFPSSPKERKLVETHISWVILCDQYVYKIKKPMHYSFLDFSTIELRKHFCERELELNRRFTENVYLEVLPIHETNNRYRIGGEKGKIIDYALKMRKLDTKKQMDVLVAKNEVSEANIEKLAERIAEFHIRATIIYENAVLDIKDKFNDIGKEKEFIAQNLNPDYGHLLEWAIKASNSFLDTYEKLLRERLDAGFFRDVHGDLHTRNIFLLPEPLPFDCIEFNDAYRQIDILNEVAFLCMDLDALGRTDLSDLFIEHYNRHFTAMGNEADRKLFVYYKSYRANIRAKVNSLRARSADNKGDKAKALAEVKKYIGLMNGYLESLDI